MVLPASHGEQQHQNFENFRQPERLAEVILLRPPTSELTRDIVFYLGDGLEDMSYSGPPISHGVADSIRRAAQFDRLQQPGDLAAALYDADGHLRLDPLFARLPDNKQVELPLTHPQTRQHLHACRDKDFAIELVECFSSEQLGGEHDQQAWIRLGYDTATPTIIVDGAHDFMLVNKLSDMTLGYNSPEDLKIGALTIATMLDLYSRAKLWQDAISEAS